MVKDSRYNLCLELKYEPLCVRLHGREHTHIRIRVALKTPFHRTVLGYIADESTLFSVFNTAVFQCIFLSPSLFLFLSLLSSSRSFSLHLPNNPRVISRRKRESLSGSKCKRFPVYSRARESHYVGK